MAVPSGPRNSRPAPAPPATRREAVAEAIHGVRIEDPYRWLEAQEAPETRAWIDLQNAYTRAWIDPIPFRAPLQRKVEALVRHDFIGPPMVRAGRYFYSRRRAGDETGILYLREGIDGQERLLVDPHPLSEDRTTSVVEMGVSEDGRLLAYGVRQGGEDEVEVRFLDVDRSKNCP